MADRIRVILADDYIPYRWALLSDLADEPSIQVIEEASDGDEALRKSLTLLPDVLVADLHMPLQEGPEVTRHLREQAPDIKVIINTLSENESDLATALKVGARGYLLKEEALELVVEAIRYVHRGGILVSPSMAEKLYAERSRTAPTNSAIPELEDDPPIDENTDTMRLSELELDMLVAEAELVITPPVGTNAVLNFHEWLTRQIGAEVDKVIPSLIGDTLLTVSFEDPAPLARFVSDYPLAHNVEKEYIPVTREFPPGVSLFRLRLELS
jgi:two-component system NarL family response regulator